MKYWIAVLFLGISFSMNSQEVEVDNNIYEVKGDVISQNGTDITETLTVEERQNIIKALKEKEIAEKEIAEKEVKKFEKEQKKQEKAQKNAEKDKKRAEKRQKQAEKELKKKQKAQKNFNKSKKAYLKAQKTYQKLKKKGKLSPEAEAKWLRKLEKLNSKLTKAERKL